MITCFSQGQILYFETNFVDYHFFMIDRETRNYSNLEKKIEQYFWFLFK